MPDSEKPCDSSEKACGSSRHRQSSLGSGLNNPRIYAFPPAPCPKGIPRAAGWGSALCSRAGIKTLHFMNLPRAPTLGVPASSQDDDTFRSTASIALASPLNQGQLQESTPGRTAERPARWQAATTLARWPRRNVTVRPACGCLPPQHSQPTLPNSPPTFQGLLYESW